jgi:hypothetical protein
MKVVLKEFKSLAEAYQYSDKMTMKGCEILELSPTQMGCRVFIKMNTDDVHDVDSFELSDTIIKAYLGLNNGKTRKFISLVEFQSLKEAFELSIIAESQGCLVHEIRALRGINTSHHLILSHDNKEKLDQLLMKKRAHTFSNSNRTFCEFLGFSDITIE